MVVAGNFAPRRPEIDLVQIRGSRGRSVLVVLETIFEYRHPNLTPHSHWGVP